MKSPELNSVLIVGCGWVGTELAKSLIAQDINVYGTTRSSDKASFLSSNGINPIILELEENKAATTKLPKADCVIISISPGRGDQRFQYPNNILKLSKLLTSTNQQVIMYSSTSAYKGMQGIVEEKEVDPDLKNENIILSAEGTLRKAIPESVILRLSGLFGSDRHPVYRLAGRQGISNGDAPVNLIHREDVINATLQIIDKNISGKIFNLCSDHHPSKKELYTKLAINMGLELPVFEPGGEDQKLVDGTKVKRELVFDYTHQNLMSYPTE